MAEKTEKTKNALTTEPYKGVRDFYPEDMASQNYIFSVWRKVAEKFGYLEYGASLLEYSELYRSKGNDEIINEQTYSFRDRGGREVTLRPEMTPTLARMVAARRKSLKFPLRWYSIPNVFRYERPQRGRRREHWQLNCDLMGAIGEDKKAVNAEVEIISLAYNIMKEFGAEDENFQILINNRKLVNFFAKKHGVQEKDYYKVTRALDLKEKISADELYAKLEEILGENTEKFLKDMQEINSDPKTRTEMLKELPEITDLIEKTRHIKNLEFHSYLARGFDYYTGMVFEVFDTNPENRRSLFGGGRYDNLLEIFGVEPVQTVGFGMGDVTIRDFLTTHSLPLNKP